MNAAVKAQVLPSADIAPLSATEARAVTDRIKVGVEAVWELITQAYVQRAWSALGYVSWDDYCTREFGTSRIRLPREERAEVVASLRESGLSIRAITAATGLGVGTVHRELAGVPNGTPAPEARVIGADGKTYSPKPALPRGETGLEELARRIQGGDQELAHKAEVLNSGGWLKTEADALALLGRECELLTSDVEPDFAEGQTTEPDWRDVIADTAEPEPTRVQAKSKRKPLPDVAMVLGLDMAKLASRIERLGADDRLVRNKEGVANQVRPHLAELMQVCQDLANKLNI